MWYKSNITICVVKYLEEFCCVGEVIIPSNPYYLSLVFIYLDIEICLDTSILATSIMDRKEYADFRSIEVLSMSGLGILFQKSFLAILFLCEWDFYVYICIFS
jgi:hypothetical protein